MLDVLQRVDRSKPIDFSIDPHQAVWLQIILRCPLDTNLQTWAILGRAEVLERRFCAFQHIGLEHSGFARWFFPRRRNWYAQKRSMQMRQVAASFHVGPVADGSRLAGGPFSAFQARYNYHPLVPRLRDASSAASFRSIGRMDGLLNPCWRVTDWMGVPWDPRQQGARSAQFSR